MCGRLHLIGRNDSRAGFASLAVGRLSALRQHPWVRPRFGCGRGGRPLCKNGRTRPSAGWYACL